MLTEPAVEYMASTSSMTGMTVTPGTLFVVVTAANIPYGGAAQGVLHVHALPHNASVLAAPVARGQAVHVVVTRSESGGCRDGTLRVFAHIKDANQYCRNNLDLWPCVFTTRVQ